jgi:hypothetical protein
MASKTKIYIVLEYVTGGELFDKIVSALCTYYTNLLNLTFVSYSSPVSGSLVCVYTPMPVVLADANVYGCTGGCIRYIKGGWKRMNQESIFNSS